MNNTRVRRTLAENPAPDARAEEGDLVNAPRAFGLARSWYARNYWG